jgi:hypothetical protein
VLVVNLRVRPSNFLRYCGRTIFPLKRQCYSMYQNTSNQHDESQSLFSRRRPYPGIDLDGVRDNPSPASPTQNSSNELNYGAIGQKRHCFSLPVRKSSATSSQFSTRSLYPPVATILLELPDEEEKLAGRFGAHSTVLQEEPSADCPSSSMCINMLSLSNEAVDARR